MIFDVVDQPTDINTALFLLTNISPSAKQSLGLDLQRLSSIDETDEDYALGDALLNTIKDLTDLGVEIHFDYGDLLNNRQELFRFIHLLEFIMPSSLYQLLKHNDVLRKTINDILSGSLTYDKSVLETYLSELGGLDGQEALFPELTEITDYYTTFLNQTPVFTDYLKQLLNLLSEQSLTKDSLITDHDSYNGILKKLITKFQYAIDQFKNVENLYNFLNKALNLFITDMIKPDNFHHYNYLWTTKQEDLPEDLISLFKSRWYHYYVSHFWCYEYYVVRNFKLTDEKAFLICIFLFLIHDNYSDFENHILDYNNQILNSVSVNFLNLYKGYLQ